MRRSRTYAVLLFSVLLSGVGCNEPFSPKGPFEPHFVAYSILSTQSDTQFVRLYLNYNPPGYDPNVVTSEQYDTTALVSISSQTSTIVLHDTLIPRTDQSRYSGTMHVFVTRSFRPQPGTGYTLTAVSQLYGSITATSTMPDKGSLSVPDESTLLFPDFFLGENIDVNIRIALETKGFLVRFLFEFGLKSDSTFLGVVEVPTSYDQNADGSLAPVYPQFQRATRTNTVLSFTVTSYVQTMTDLAARYGEDIILKRAKFYLVQVDEGLYNYYSVVNGFQDKYSIRSDQPDYTNIHNGLGVFGSFNVDSLVIRL